MKNAALIGIRHRLVFIARALAEHNFLPKNVRAILLEYSVQPGF